MNKLRILRLCVASVFLFTSSKFLVAEEQPISTPEVATKDLRCLASAIHHEAGGESRTGQLAVAHVVLNRMMSGIFPTSLCEVVYQKTSGTCQFSWACSPSKKRQEPSLDALELAWEVMVNETKDPSKGALYFHATYLGRIFKRKQTTVIGNHVFYK